MPYTIVKGNFRILNAQPDGDSVKFYPSDPAAWTKANLQVHPNGQGGVQLRLDGIDALETHFTPRGGMRTHQPPALAHAAGEALLNYLEFTNVIRDANETVLSASPAQVPGFILTRFADKYGRAVAFAFKGDDPATDITDFFLTPQKLEQCANYQLLLQGMVYPTFYSKLYTDLRRHMTAAVQTARNAQSGVWAQDVTNAGADIATPASLEDDLVIMPKLFRRLVEYIALNEGDIDMSGFITYLDAKNDRLTIIDGAQPKGYKDIVNVQGQVVRMTERPEDIYFMEG